MMDKDVNKKPVLRVIQGGLRSKVTFGSLQIAAASDKKQPFRVDAIVLEEDTWLVMSASPKTYPSEEHPIRFMTDLIETKPEPVGSVLIKGDHPVRMLAVVHDINQEPTWREEWIESALIEVFHLSEQQKFESIGLNLLGTKHGRLEKRRFAVLLGKVLRQVSLVFLKRVWLITPVGVNHEIIENLKCQLDSE